MSILVHSNTKVLVQGITGSFGGVHAQHSLAYGTQIVAGRSQDLRVLQTTRAFERARPWADRRPAL